jgi:ABC-type dipeptide/oligopeptide/nickel transport system permease subunit
MFVRVHIPRFARTPRGAIGLLVLGIVVLIALVGPAFAPDSAVATVGVPGSAPSGAHLLGTDVLGRDVLSRVLSGGRTVLSLSLAATLLAFAIGTTVGLVAGYSRSLLDPVLMRLMDVILAFPPLLFFLIVATSVGTSELMLVVGAALVQAPGVARIVYSATRETSVKGYVEAAIARGEKTPAILSREIFPNINAVLIANFGLTLTFSVLIVAAVNFLGVGLQPPSSNWALMISENRPIISVNVWATLAPAALIAALTIGVNLVGDAISHSLGHREAIADLVGSTVTELSTVEAP